MQISVSTSLPTGSKSIGCCMAKREVHEEHENHERWLVSYADFITLLFAFFVVLYATGRVDQTKFKQVAQSMRWAMHIAGEGGVVANTLLSGESLGGNCVVDLGANADNAKKKNKRYAEEVRRRVEGQVRSMGGMSEKKSPIIAVDADEKSMMIQLSGTHFFDAGDAALRPDAIPYLDAIFSELQKLRRPVRIEGHTDNRPSTGKYANNWLLSSARASAVVVFAEKAYQMYGKMSVAGFADTKPVASNETEEGREQNRRISIVVELNPTDKTVYEPRPADKNADGDTDSNVGDADNKNSADNDAAAPAVPVDADGKPATVLPNGVVIPPNSILGKEGIGNAPLPGDPEPVK